MAQRAEIQKSTSIVLGVEPKSLLNFRKDLIEALIQKRHNVIAASLQQTEAQKKALSSIGAQSKGIYFKRTGLNPLRDLVTLVALFRFFRDARPSIVIAYTAKPVIYGSFAAKLCSVPKFTAMITGLGYAFVDGQGYKRKIVRLIVSWLYRAALKDIHCVIFQNPDDLKTFREMKLVSANTRVAVVNGSGVDLEHFVVRPLPVLPVFIMVARLLVDKGIREYAEACHLLRAEFPNVRTLLAGRSDPSPGSIQSSELEIWIKNGLEYLGEYEDVREAIAMASVVVLPSYREGTPRSVLEGMAMGRAIVTTDAPGCRETVIMGQNGFLVRVRSVPELLAAMRQLTQDSQLVAKMGASSRVQAEIRYDARVVAREVVQHSE